MEETKHLETENEIWISLEKELEIIGSCDWNRQTRTIPGLGLCAVNIEEELLPLPQSLKGIQGEPLSVLDFKDVFPRPTSNERERIARGSDSRLLPLSMQQLKDIRERGSFYVESQEFPGHRYCWTLNTFFQLGKKPAFDTFWKGVVFGTELSFFWSIDYLWSTGYYSDRLSVFKGLVSVARGIKNLSLWVFGEPYVQGHTPHDIIQKMEKYRIRCMLRKICGDANPTKEKFSFEGFPIDFTVPIKFEGKLVHEAVSQVLKEENFFVNVKKECIKNRQFVFKNLQIQNPQSSLPEILQKLSDEEEMYSQNKYYALLGARFPDISVVLVNYCKAKQVVKQTCKDDSQRKDEAWKKQSEALQRKHSVLSQIKAWNKKQEKLFEMNWNNSSTLLNSIIDQLPNGQEKVLATLARSVMNCPEAQKMESSLKKERIPISTITHEFRIWFPSDWVITNTNNSFSVQKYRTLQTCSNYYGWRVHYFFLFVASLFWNGTFFLLANAVYGALGIVSFTGFSDFQPDRDVDRHSGAIIPSGPIHKTLLGRITSLWKNISESRRSFESSRDSGFFGKKLTRMFNVFWNYMILGFFGTIIVFSGHLSAGLLVTSISLLLGSTGIVWAPIVGLLWILVLFSFHDSHFELPILPVFGIVFWRILICGILQIIVCVGLSLFCFVGGFVWYVLSAFRYSLRIIYDLFMFFCLIKWNARVPYEDGFVARLVSGPGVGQEYFYQIRTEQVLLIVQENLENQEIHAYQKRILWLLGGPLRKLHAFFNKFQTYGLIADPNGKILKNFSKTKELLTKQITDLLQEKKKERQIIVADGIKNVMLRMTRDDLANATWLVQQTCEGFYSTRIFPYMHADEINEFWNKNGATENDWECVSNKLLRQIFHENFFTPIEDVDGSFRLEVVHVRTEEYFRRLWAGSLKDDLDVKTPMVDSVVETVDQSTALQRELPATSIANLNWETELSIKYTRYISFSFQELKDYARLNKDKLQHSGIEILVNT